MNGWEIKQIMNCYWPHRVHYNDNKKVLLRERKRHTTRRVVNTPPLVLTGYPPSWPGQGGTLPGYPPSRVPSQPGYPPSRVPPSQGIPHPPARVPPTRVPPLAGYPPRLDLAGYPPAWTWQGIPPAAPWHSGKCCKALWDMGTPPCRQTKPWMDRHVSKHYLPVVLRTRAVTIRSAWNRE